MGEKKVKSLKVVLFRLQLSLMVSRMNTQLKEQRKSLFDFDELRLENNIPGCHPKAMALEKSLESVRLNICDTPQSCIKR